MRDQRSPFAGSRLSSLVSIPLLRLRVLSFSVVAILICGQDGTLFDDFHLGHGHGRRRMRVERRDADER
jgi:hypothetical protein